MLKYKVINTKTGEDITDEYDWVLTPNGDLYYTNQYNDFCYYVAAKVEPVIQCLDIPQ